MQVEVKLNINQQEFFDYLIQSLLIDIYKNTEVFQLKEDIHKGFQYKKRIKDNKGKEYDSLVEIQELEEPILYQSQVTTGSNHHILRIECCEENQQVIVTYHEKVISNKLLRQWNYVLVSSILSRFYKKQIKKMLMNMELHIQRSK